jgi:uncharacterized membrane protein
MPDPTDPSQPPPPPPSSEPETRSTSTSIGLPSNVAAAIACIPLIGGIIFYILEKRDSFVRFYAMQSIIFGIAWILISIGCALVSGLLGAIPIEVIANILQGLWNMVTWLIYIGLFVIVIVAVVRALGGVRWDIPYIGPIARKQVEGSAP